MWRDTARAVLSDPDLGITKTSLADQDIVNAVLHARPQYVGAAREAEGEAERVEWGAVLRKGSIGIHSLLLFLQTTHFSSPPHPHACFACFVRPPLLVCRAGGCCYCRVCGTFN